MRLGKGRDHVRSVGPCASGLHTLIRCRYLQSPGNSSYGQRGTPLKKFPSVVGSRRRLSVYFALSFLISSTEGMSSAAGMVTMSVAMRKSYLGDFLVIPINMGSMI